MRAATTGIGDDGIELVRRKLIELLSGQLLGQFPFAIVRMQRAATNLFGGRYDFAAVPRQHLNGVTVDVTENEVLSAPEQHRHAVLASTQRRGDRRDKVCRESGL